MKSIGNGWKRAQEARKRNRPRDLLGRDFFVTSLNIGPGGVGACFDKHGNMTQSTPIYAVSQGFHLDAARAVREGLINPPMPRSKRTAWQRFKNWLA